jgi:hypothetical protein
MSEMDTQTLRKVIDDAHDARAPDVEGVVNKAISATLQSFGIEQEDRKELQADFRHLRKWRKSVESAEGLGFKVVFGTIVSGFLGAVWLGFKALVGHS